MEALPDWLQRAVNLVPASLHGRSGKVFYSGREAFSGRRPVYILGLNPGGCPTRQADETVLRHLDEWGARPSSWSAYLDESWLGRAPGAYGMQPRMAHMFRVLGLDLRQVPASNAVFVRSSTEDALEGSEALMEQCWPFHDAVLHGLGVQVVLCLGSSAGRQARQALGADRCLDHFTERNARRWTSTAHGACDGRVVLTVTHPGRADWCNPAADPTPLVRSVVGAVVA